MTPTTTPQDSNQRGDIEESFPFESYRAYQREILLEAEEALFETPGIVTVVIDAPTGIGKSGINIALANHSHEAFYTTPQKKLRDQLNQDDSLAPHHSVLRSRRDYICNSTPSEYATGGRTYNCQSCPVNNRNDVSCQELNCKYWREKQAAMNDTVSTVTFAFLIVDNRLPSYTAMVNGEPVRSTPVMVGDDDVVSTTQISFDHREVLVIDEAHTLTEQVTSLHAGVELSTSSIETEHISVYTADQPSDSDAEPEHDPYAVFKTQMQQKLGSRRTSVEALSASELTGVLEQTKAAVEQKHSRLSSRVLNEYGGKVKSRLNSINWKIGNVLQDVRSGNPWVVTGKKSGNGDYHITLKPVWADTFLRQNVWNRAEKVILSTATLPFRANPSKWLRLIGRDPSKAKVISKPMPFPAENRPVRLDYQIGSMSNEGVKEHWDDIVETIQTLAEKHHGQKGLVHTVSYDRAERLHEAISDISHPHEPDTDLSSKELIDKWQQSNKQLLLTPAMTEGVDLEGDLCRWQVLLKVPFRSTSDPRVEYLLNEENDWEWYNDLAAREIIQSVGRAVRSSDDYATYYVLDSKFEQVMDGRMPEWFKDAIVRSATHR